MRHRFRDRREAGQLLAAKLSACADRLDVLVLGLPRGGVPVAYEVARAIRAPLDVLVVRKLGVPGQAELAMGAIASGGVKLLNTEVVEEFGIPQRVINAVAEREQQELERREQAYRDERPPAELRGKTVILVDDGLATGMTMRAAIAAVRRQASSAVVVAVPVIAQESCPIFRVVVDALVWVIAPERFYAVGLYYEDFTPTTDAEVCDLLARAAREPASPRPAVAAANADLQSPS